MRDLPTDYTAPPQMTASPREFLRLLLRLTVALVLLVWVFRKIGWQALAGAISTTQWEFVAGACAVELLSSWINAVKLRCLLMKLGCAIRTTTVFSASAISSLYGMFLPGFLSSGAKWYILRKDSGNGTAVLTGMVYNQTSVTVVMLIFGLLALMVANPLTVLSGGAAHRGLVSGGCLVLLVALVAGTILALSRGAGGRLLGLLRLRLKWLPRRFQDGAHRFLGLLETFQRVGWRFHLAMALITICASVVCGAVKYRLAAEAVGIPVSWYVLMWLYALVYILGRIPITLANLGVREVTLVGLLHIYGVEQPQALLMSMVLFFVQIFMALVGMYYQIAWSFQEKRRRSVG